MKKIISMGMIWLLGNAVSAGVSDLEQLQSVNSNIVYQYTFEGVNTNETLDQKISPNSPDLVQYRQLGTYTTTNNNITFDAGYDSSSQAAGVWAGGLASGKRASGVGLKSAATITMGTSGTIEYLVKAAAINDAGFAVTGSSSTNRWYMFYNGAALSDAAYMNIGGSASGIQMIGGTTTVSYAATDWYYVAQTWSISGGTVTMNAWVANMSLATPVLTQTIVNRTAAYGGGGVTTNLFRLGSNTDTDNFFKGNLDAVAIYNTKLDAAAIASHMQVTALGFVPAVWDISAAYRHGQVFIQWNESAENSENLRVYMHTEPITSANFAQAQLVEQRIEPHSANDWYEDPAECPKAPPAGSERGWILEDGGPAVAARTGGLFVHTVTESDPAQAYFAVLADSQNGADIAAGQNSLTSAVAMVVAPVRAIWQLGTPTVNSPPAVGKPLVLTLHAHTSRPNPLTYLVFGDKSMGWREGLPFKFKVSVTNDVVLVEPYDRVWINRKMSATEAQANYGYDATYKNIESWWFGTNDKIYDPAQVSTGTAVNYTERWLLWVLDWVQQTYQTDTNRVYAYGTSMGTGVQRLALQNPDRFACVDLLVPILDPFGEGNVGLRMQARVGPPDNICSDGMPLRDRLNTISKIESAGTDLPVMIIRVGRTDGSVYWNRKPDYMEAMQSGRHGLIAGWDNGDHTTAMRTGNIPGFPNFGDYTYASSHFALNRSYPAFSRFSMNQNPGNGDPADGDITGFINRGLEWSDIVDLENGYAVKIHVTHPDAVYPVTVDVTPRNLQNFQLKPGQTLRAQNRNSAGTVVEEKELTVDESGRLTYEMFTIDSAQGNTLTVMNNQGVFFSVIAK